MRWWAMVVLLTLSSVASALQDAAPAESPLVRGRRALAAKQFVEAKKIFVVYARAHSGDVQGLLGLADAELGLREFEAAELAYRAVTAKQPLLWAAHKNLVIVEAALGRWEEFDREREVLRAARERGAAGIGTHESDVIEVLDVRGERWIVRDYFEPAGRSQTRYNFERFSAQGKVMEYVSLESADAFREQAMADSVLVGAGAKGAGSNGGLALDWYDGKSHGVIAMYGAEPKYEVARRDFLRWVGRRSTPAP